MKPFGRIPSALPRSGIREIMDLAWATPGVIHLEVGQPDFDTPEHIVEAACRYARQGHTRYVPNAGIDEVREAAARYIQGKTGVPTDKENILVTQGAVLSVATAFLAILDAGDEILLPDPGWPNYSMAVTLMHGRPVFYSLSPERQFLPDLDELESLVTDRTKLILLCSPSNPTGQVHDKELTEKLVEFARRHDLYVLADEIYAEIVFVGVAHTSAASFDTDGRVLLVTGMSKAYAMTGGRIGYAGWPEALVEGAVRLCINDHSCVNAATQYAAIEALTGPQGSVAAMVAAFAARRSVMVDELNAIPGFACARPQGAFYAFPNITGTGLDARRLQDKLLTEAEVATVAGTSFGAYGEGYLRFSYAASIDHIREAMARIRSCL